MNVLFTVLAVIALIASLLLIGAVLLQNGKGDGLATNFVAGNQTFGVRKTADILEKITWWLVGIIAVLCILSNFTTGSNGSSIDITEDVSSSAQQEQPVFPSSPFSQENPAVEE